ncbi:MAG: hypothetical protein LUC41_09180 [Clostridiales bacterium]|nr:hypothetical protein [Clostridiales bacterium]
MNPTIPIINKTMDLSEVADCWTFDEKYNVWCLEDVIYTPKAVTPKFQRLSIFVPAPYMKEGGVIDPEGEMNGYTAATAPVILNNNSAGYMQMPHMWLGGPRCFGPQYLERGFVYVTCGNRGHESKDANGVRTGKAPANLIDLKVVLRFLRHNTAYIPGDLEKIVSVGWSAGGAMSTLLSVTGNNKNYDRLLEEAGAFMDERDDVYAAQIYCPITDLDHADLAYEWMFNADKENESSPAGPAGVMTPFEEALSEKLKNSYICYFNNLGLTDPETGDALVLNPDGRSGSAYDYLMKVIDASITKFLAKLDKGELDADYSVADYLSGNYSSEVMAPPGDDKDDADMMQGHAGPGVALNKPPIGGPEGMPGEPMEPPTLGDMVSRPPKGAPEMPSFAPPTMMVPGKDKSGWLSWDGSKAHVCDLDTYILNHRRRMKPCTAFDILSCQSGENKVYGTPDEPVAHFNDMIAGMIADLKDDFPEEYEKYYKAYAVAVDDPELERQKYLINPFNYIGTDEESDQAKYYRIRVGASDADTSFSVSMTLALLLANNGKPVDYALVWDQPHSEADYPGEVCDWIEEVCGK